jgi:hypothetical protein
VELPCAQRPSGIITLKGRTLNTLAQLFIECAREVAKQLIPVHARNTRGMLAHRTKTK